MTYDGKIVLVTGGGSGIGEATARAFATEGAHVVIADVCGDAQRVVDEISSTGRIATYSRVDVSDDRQVRGLIDDVVNHFGRLDVAFNNAGVGVRSKRLHEYEEELFDRDVAVNLKGTFLCMKHEIQQFLNHGGGVIVNMSSVAGLRASPGLAGYGAAKAGVFSLTQTAAVEYARDAIRVNVVCPGGIDTKGLRGGMTAQSIERLMDRVPQKRLGVALEVAETVLWLCSDRASYVTGAVVAIDGGQSC
ncbi:SDR family NAD(P)-dependent oxidoreductase [Paraburkholderia aspalathi]|uniref:SDR family NAD(P)-dependent oxidoreductase n=1 Tax=Paraburkholderia aspalathi TaxID=1324617 RepID=UPI0038B71978